MNKNRCSKWHQKRKEKQLIKECWRVTFQGRLSSTKATSIVQPKKTSKLARNQSPTSWDQPKALNIKKDFQRIKFIRSILIRREKVSMGQIILIDWCTSKVRVCWCQQDRMHKCIKPPEAETIFATTLTAWEEAMTLNWLNLLLVDQVTLSIVQALDKQQRNKREIVKWEWKKHQCQKLWI